MRKPSIVWLTLLLVIASILFSSCQPGQITGTFSPETSEPVQTSTTESETAPGLTLDSSTQSEPVDGTTPTQIQPTPTPIVETRLSPEQWREWPVVPELTGREQAIYRLGQELGNDPQSFSKVGDCQAIKDVLMGIYDQPNRYYLTDNDAYLQETIDYFAGSFGRDGQGVRGGFNAAAVINPFLADPEACSAGETPIECEYNIHQPSFVIISLEVWWDGRTVERYEEYMRQIINFYISNGVVPILSTKADNVEGDHRINLATAKLAYEYHIPLWNFWRAVQSMPNKGIDPNRDGFHISYEAWTVRSYTALQALDAVWRGVRDQQTQTVVETEQPENTFDPASILISPDPIEMPAGLNGEILLFSVMQRTGEVLWPQGIYAYNIEDQTLYQILASGYKLEDINTETNTLLVSKDQQLFTSDLSGKNLYEITADLAITSRDASAFWMPDGIHILMLTEDNEANTLWMVNPSDSTRTSLAQGEITGILKPGSDGMIYWYEGTCEPDLPCEDVTLWRLNDGEPEAFAALDRVVFANSGNEYSWIKPSGDTNLILYTRDADQTGQNFTYLPGNRWVDMSWSPSKDQLAILSVTRSEYTGKSSDARIFVVNTNTMISKEYLSFPGLNPSFTWNINHNELLLTSTLLVDQSYQLNLSQLDLGAGTFTPLNEEINFQSADYLTINKLFWIIPITNGGQ